MGNSEFFIIDKMLLEYKGDAEAVVIPDSVEIIGKEAFSGCSKLCEVVIPDTVKVIGTDAFFRCRSLKRIVIPPSVKDIRELAFGYCTALTEVVLPNTLRNIWSGLFSGCKSLSKVVIPDSVDRIWWNAFENCTSLCELIIPNSVTSIGTRAFFGCKNLRGLVIPNSVMEIFDDALTGLEEIVLPKRFEERSNEILGGKSNLPVAEVVYVSFDCYSKLSGKLKPSAMRGFLKRWKRGELNEDEIQALKSLIKSKLSVTFDTLRENLLLYEFATT